MHKVNNNFLTSLLQKYNSGFCSWSTHHHLFAVGHSAQPEVNLREGGDGEGLKKTEKRINLVLGGTLLSDGETVPQPASGVFIV